MALDIYSPCIGGCSQKIKFCGCKDIVSELDRLVNSISGGQNAAARETLNRLRQKHGQRACFLALESECQMRQGDLEGLQTLSAEFLELQPDNQIALATAAIVHTFQGDLPQAVNLLQDAWERVDESLDERLLSALANLSSRLHENNYWLAARGHAILLAQMGEELQKHSSQLLAELHRSPDWPLLFKEDSLLGKPPEGVEWAAALEEVMALIGRGCWRKAIQALTPLAEQHNHRQLWQNLAVLHGWLCQEDQAASAWEKCAAACEDRDEAISALARSQWLDSDRADDSQQAEFVQQTYTVTESDEVMERLLSDRFFRAYDPDPSAWTQQELPPPKAAFRVLDREALVEFREDLKPDEIPQIQGAVMLFGKQLDREARIEFSWRRWEGHTQPLEKVQEVVGDRLGELESEEVLERHSLVSVRMHWQWELPPNTPPKAQSRLLFEQRRHVSMEVWPQVAMPELGGATPQQAVADPEKQIAVQAAILLLELDAERDRFDFDFNLLREQLDLPKREPLAAFDWSNRLSLINLHLAPVEEVEDKPLVELLQNASFNYMPRAVRRIAMELLRRETIREEIPAASLYGILFQFALNEEEAMGSLEAARKAAIAAGQSPAPWLLRELEFHAAGGNGEKVNEIFQRLQSRHMEEPGVAEALYRFLGQIGMLGPEGGMPPAGGMAPAEVAPEETSSLLTGEPPAASGGALWTGGPEPPASNNPPSGDSSAEEKPSALWTPETD